MRHLLICVYLLHFHGTADPFETGWHDRGPGEERAASHFTTGSRAHESEPWSSHSNTDWQIVEYDRVAGRVAGYHTRTGEVFNTAPGSGRAAGIGCFGCLLFDVGSCHVLSPAAFRAVPHSLEPYDRERREQLWRIADAKGVRDGDLPVNFAHSHPPQRTDEVWHVVSERDERVDMTLFAWIEPGSTGSHSVARRLRCLAGWCKQFPSGPIDSLLASLVLLPLPASLLDANTANQRPNTSGCGRLSRKMLIQVQQRATRIIPLAATHGQPRARVLSRAKSAASNVIFAADALAPVTGMIQIYATAVERALDQNFTSRSANSTGQYGLDGFCDAPHDPMVASVLQTDGLSFTPEYVNVTMPIRALGEFCRVMAICVITQIRWIEAFASCLYGEGGGALAATQEVRVHAIEGFTMLTALLGAKAMQLSASTGASGGALADEIVEAAETVSIASFHRATDILKLTDTLASGDWIRGDRREKITEKFACCYVHASHYNSNKSKCD